MKILALSDIHGAFDAAIRILDREPDAHAVIIAGDLTTNGTPQQARDAIKAFQRFGKPLYAVAGNMDSPDIDEVFDELGVGINGRGLLMDYIGLFGVSASPVSPLHTPYEISEEDISLRAHAGWKDIQAEKTMIFVPHAPPFGTKVDRLADGTHAGSTSVRSFIEQFHPTVVVCGHIHEARGIDSLGGSTIVNCGPAGRGNYAVISLGKETTVEMKG